MKKTTMIAIANALQTVDFENKTAIMEELMNEVNRGEAKKAATAAEYVVARDVVMGVLNGTTAPLTAGEIFEACADELPSGFTRNKVSYGLLHYWGEDVVKIDGKVNTYRRK